MKTTNMRVTGSSLMIITTIQQAIACLCDTNHTLRIKGFEFTVQWRTEESGEVKAEVMVEATDGYLHKKESCIIVDFCIRKVVIWAPINGPIHVFAKGFQPETEVRLEHEFGLNNPVSRSLEMRSMQDELRWGAMQKALYPQ